MSISESQVSFDPRDISTVRPPDAPLWRRTQRSPASSVPHPALRDIERVLALIEVSIGTALRRCEALRGERSSASIPQRDVLHLRARIQGLQACAEDATVVLNRLKRRERAEES